MTIDRETSGQKDGPELPGNGILEASQVPKQTSDEKTKHRICIAVLLAVVVLAYGNSLRNAFTMDDLYLYIVDNPQVTEPSLRGLFAPHNITKAFRPVTFGTFALDWKIGGGRPFEFHAVNLLLHAGVTVLLYLLLQILLQGLPHGRSEEHTSELQSQSNLVCRLLLEKKKIHKINQQASNKQTTK